jgi:D-alanyl-D-alanine carboxypeptidase
MFNMGIRNMTAARTAFESYAFTAGGISASTQATAAFFHALCTGEWLSLDTVAQVINTVGAPDEDIPHQTSYGLGVRYLVIGSESVYGHTSSTPGYFWIVMHNLERGFTIVVLSNVSTIEDTNVFAGLQSIVMGSE